MSADSIREKIARTCEAANAKAMDKAINEYQESDDYKYMRENAEYAITSCVQGFSSFEKTGLPKPLRKYTAEVIARVLTMATEPLYMMQTVNYDLSDDQLIEKYKKKSVSVTTGSCHVISTKESEYQRSLRMLFKDYATYAAVCAKKISSPSLLEWVEIIDIIDPERNDVITSQLTANEALRVIELEKSAASRLRLDLIAASLPKSVEKPVDNFVRKMKSRFAEMRAM